MKVYWGLRRKHADVLASIDRLERELGMNVGHVVRQSEEHASPDPLVDGGFDLSSARARQMREINAMVSGAAEPVNEGGSVGFLPAYSSVASRIEMPSDAIVH